MYFGKQLANGGFARAGHANDNQDAGVHQQGILQGVN
jgi:hypothetical protein